MNTATDLLPPHHNLQHHLDIIYADLYDTESRQQLAGELLDLMRIPAGQPLQNSPSDKWQADDIAVICYGNSVIKPGEKPLQTLLSFSRDYLQPYSNILHILPFFPYCSDDGFAVKDFFAVNPELGDWADIQAIAGD